MANFSLYRGYYQYVKDLIVFMGPILLGLYMDVLIVLVALWCFLYL